MLKTAPSVSRKSTSTAVSAPELSLRSTRPSVQSHNRLTRLQSVHGNQSVQRQLGRGILQAKLTVNQPGDSYEQEADRVADAVMRMSASGASDPPWQPDRASAGVQRCSCGGPGGETGQCQECKEKGKEKDNENEMSLHRVESDSSQIDTAPPIVSEVLGSPGQPLDASTRAFMEARMGHDFSQVRVHTGARAADSAKAVNAIAYAVGTNVVFGAGEYAPSSPAGQRLLAHELTHTLQQTSASALRVARAPSTSKCETFNYPGRKAGVSAVPGKPSIDDQGVTGISGTSFERFAESSNSLTPFQLTQIVSLQSTLAAADTVEVHGYASCDGGPEYNLGLSSDRAEAVKKALTTTGKSPFTGTVTTLAHGETNEFGSTLDVNRRAIVVVHHVTPKPCPQCPEEPRTEGCPPCPPQPEPPVFFCNKEITGSLIHRQGHAFFRIGGAAPGSPTFELEHDERGDHCACGFQGIPQRDFKEDVDATDAKCVAAPGISASCLAKNWNTYPIGKYCALGPNSNTYARFLAEKCGGKGLKPPGGVQGFDDSPPPAGTANDTSTVFTLRCNEISCDDQSCLPPTPPPPDRGTQVECVKDLGLCGIPGGILSAEDIHRWNEECRRRTGYTGEDITTEECANVNLQRKESSGGSASLSDAGRSSVQEVLRSPGKPLEGGARTLMEGRFGQRFDSVRVHADASAEQSAREMNALAYTAGDHVVFGDGQYAPQSYAGQHLIAHELAHVVQQRTRMPDGQVQRKCGPKDVGPTPPGCEIVPSSAKAPITGERFFFNVNCDEFAPGEGARLQAFIDPTKLTSGTNITIRGMASADGAADFNQSLSCSRAAAAVAVLNAKGLGPNIKSVVATGGIPGTMHDPKFRAVEVTVTGSAVPTQGPAFSIVGNPKVTAVANPSNTTNIDTLLVSQAMGDFDLSAVVSMQATQASDFDDWQIGAVQTAVEPAHQRCFKFPAGVTPPPAHQHPNEVFVASLQGLPGALVPDRDDSDPIFMSVKFKDDLATIHQGRTSFTSPVTAHDTPKIGGLNGLFNVTQDPLDGQSLVFREHKFLFALTHVIARQKSSGRIIPLYTAEWFTFWDIAYDPSAGTGIPPVEHVLDRRFEKISDHRFAAADQAPVVGGKSLRNFKFGGQYQASCPSF